MTSSHAPIDDRRPPRPPRTLHESLELFGGAWLAAGATTLVGGLAVLARLVGA